MLSLFSLNSTVYTQATNHLSQQYLALAFTDKDMAIIDRSRVESEMIDHYGNPTQFKHYIINLPSFKV